MVASVEEAFESLKPPEILKADSTETAYTRQGDIFAVETLYGKRELRSMGAAFGKRAVLLGTNHTASEVALLPDGRVFARGMLRHEPENRPADHGRRRIGDGKMWHEITRNTVPRSFDVPRAFTARGMID